MSESEEVDKLAAELWAQIEAPQGFAFVSDAETFATKAEFFERIRGRLAWQKKGVAVMTDFLRKHGQLY